MLSMLKTTHNKCLLGDFNARSGKSKHICLDNISANHNDMDEKIRQSLEHINVLLDLKFPLIVELCKNNNVLLLMTDSDRIGKLVKIAVL